MQKQLLRKSSTALSSDRQIGIVDSKCFLSYRVSDVFGLHTLWRLLMGAEEVQSQYLARGEGVPLESKLCRCA